MEVKNLMRFAIVAPLIAIPIVAIVTLPPAAILLGIIAGLLAVPLTMIGVPASGLVAILMAYTIIVTTFVLWVRKQINNAQMRNT